MPPSLSSLPQEVNSQPHETERAKKTKHFNRTVGLFTIEPFNQKKDNIGIKIRKLYPTTSSGKSDNPESSVHNP
jgi:hypothetical protein